MTASSAARDWWSALPNWIEPVKLKFLLTANTGGVWGEDPDGQGDTVVLRSTEQTVDGNWRIDAPASRRLTLLERHGALLCLLNV